MKIFEKNSKDSFYNAILYGAYCALLHNKEKFEFGQSDAKFVAMFGQIFFWRAPGEKIQASIRSKPLKFSNAVSCH